MCQFFINPQEIPNNFHVFFRNHTNSCHNCPVYWNHQMKLITNTARNRCQLRQTTITIYIDCLFHTQPVPMHRLLLFLPVFLSPGRLKSQCLYESSRGAADFLLHTRTKKDCRTCDFHPSVQTVSLSSTLPIGFLPLYSAAAVSSALLPLSASALSSAVSPADSVSGAAVVSGSLYKLASKVIWLHTFSSTLNEGASFTQPA